MTVSEKVPVQGPEFQQAELDLLRLEVDSISQDMKVLKRLLITTDTILKKLLKNMLTEVSD